MDSVSFQAEWVFRGEGQQLEEAMKSKGNTYPVSDSSGTRGVGDKAWPLGGH